MTCNNEATKSRTGKTTMKKWTSWRGSGGPPTTSSGGAVDLDALGGGTGGSSLRKFKKTAMAISFASRTKDKDKDKDKDSDSVNSAPVNPLLERYKRAKELAAEKKQQALENGEVYAAGGSGTRPLKGATTGGAAGGPGQRSSSPPPSPIPKAKRKVARRQGSGDDGKLTAEALRSLEAKRRAAARLQFETLGMHLQTFQMLLGVYAIQELQHCHRLVLGLIQASQKQRQILKKVNDTKPSIELSMSSHHLLTTSASVASGIVDTFHAMEVAHQKKPWRTCEKALMDVDSRLSKHRAEIRKYLQDLDTQTKILQTMRTAEDNIIHAWDAYLEVASKREEAEYNSRRAHIVNKAAAGSGGGGGGGGGTTTATMDTAKQQNSDSTLNSRISSVSSVGDMYGKYNDSDTTPNSLPVVGTGGSAAAAATTTDATASAAGGGVPSGGRGLVARGGLDDGSVSTMSTRTAAVDAWLAELKYRKALTVQNEQTWDRRFASMQEVLLACQAAEVRRRLYVREAMQTVTAVTKQLFLDLESAQVTSQNDIERHNNADETTVQAIEQEVEEAILSRIEELKKKRKRDKAIQAQIQKEGSDGNDKSFGDESYEDDSSRSKDGTDSNGDKDDDDDDDSSLGDGVLLTEDKHHKSGKHKSPANKKPGGLENFYEDMYRSLEVVETKKKKLDAALSSATDRLKRSTVFRDEYLSSSPLSSDFLRHAAIVEILATADLALAVVTVDGMLHVFSIPTLRTLQEPVDAAMKQLLAASTQTAESADNEGSNHEGLSSLKKPWKSIPLAKLAIVSSDKEHQVLQIAPDKAEPDVKLSLRASSDKARADLVRAIESTGQQ